MPNLSNWLNDTQTGLSLDLANMRNRDVVEIALVRGATTLDAQCVRVVPVNLGSLQGETAGNNVPTQMGVALIGAANLNIKKGDLFSFRSGRYKVISVMLAVQGHVQATAEGTQ